MNNIQIISEFERLMKQINYDIDNEKDKKKKTVNLFRLKQIGNAYNIIKKYPEEIKSGEQLKEIKGIGAGIMRRIDEIIKTGKLAEITLKEKDVKTSEAVEELKEIYGIGEKTAFELVTKNNIHSIGELKDAFVAGAISLNSNIVMGLKYHNIYQQKIPRSEMKKIDKYLQQLAKEVDDQLDVIVCGSYRREKTTSNDIDCMLSHPKIKTQDDLKTKKNYLHNFIDVLKENKFIVDALTSEDVETKFMGFCRYSVKTPIRRIDIRYIPSESYFPALIYFTGSGSFNQTMRQYAKKLGYKLNEYGLYKQVGTKYKLVPVSSEEEIFEKLGMKYVEPKDRI